MTWSVWLTALPFLHSVLNAQVLTFLCTVAVKVRSESSWLCLSCNGLLHRTQIATGMTARECIELNSCVRVSDAAVG